MGPCPSTAALPRSPSTARPGGARRFVRLRSWQARCRCRGVRRRARRRASAPAGTFGSRPCRRSRARRATTRSAGACRDAKEEDDGDSSRAGVGGVPGRDRGPGHVEHPVRGAGSVDEQLEQGVRKRCEDAAAAKTSRACRRLARASARPIAVSERTRTIARPRWSKTSARLWSAEDWRSRIHSDQRSSIASGAAGMTSPTTTTRTTSRAPEQSAARGRDRNSGSFRLLAAGSAADRTR
jgi:hypothetical protein